MQALDRLTAMARSGDEVDRNVLVDVLTDLFLAVEGAKAEELAQVFGSVVLSFFSRLEDSARLSLANRVSDHKLLPRDVAIRLADDDLLEIAALILQNSPVLETDDLVALAERKEQPHLKALAERKGLSAPVTDVIVRRGTNDVLRAVTGNRTASLSVDSFDALVAKSRKDEELQEALVRRHDLPPDPAKRLIPFLSRQIRGRLESIAGHPGLLQLLTQCMADEVKSQLREMGSAQAQTESAIAAVVEGKAPLDEVATFFAKNDKPVDLALLFSRVGNVSETVTTRLVLKGDDGPLILLCRALELSPEAFAHIVRMRSRRLRMTGQQAQDSLAQYAEMSPERAREILSGGRKAAE
ncbi:DUF2336 domain-containing protein [Breoghania sp.]|uniref:DUF2336 domain-containing protein n=1 Tax=Breoghania sp. TaxID=2065378 RepID=UPI002AABEE12|nr:DUF2336 domain-containing protein [Breoghania sp.]